MYKALYRKYRPENFEDLIGQEVIKQTLSNSIKNNKLSHAYLFCGPRGTGKTSVAKLFGKIINCENPNNLKPCNKCVFCTQYNSKQINDIIEIDAASNNGVDEIRELKSKIDLMPSVGKYKIYIIDEVHMLTPGAFNALLKTLEEPPSHAIFILATTEVHKIPETILSRCQRFDFKKITDDKIVERLKFISQSEKITVSDESLFEIARISKGGMRDSISLLDQVAAYSNNDIKLSDVEEVSGSVNEDVVFTLISSIIKNDLNSVLTKISILSNKGKNMSRLIEDIISFLRNILLYKEAREYIEENISDLSRYEELSSKLDNNTIIRMINTFNKAIIEMKNFNQPMIAIQLAFISLLEKKEEFGVKTENEKNDKVKKVNSENKINEKEKSLEIKVKYERNPDFENFRNIRINNTLANFNKKELISIKKSFDELRPLLLDPDLSEYISLLLDGEIKAASDEYLIFIYPNERMLKQFDDNILNLEDIILKNLNKKYKIVSVDLPTWEVIKKEFNTKSKKYEYKEEKDNSVLFTQNNNSDDMTSLFGNIIEYN